MRSLTLLIVLLCAGCATAESPGGAADAGYAADGNVTPTVDAAVPFPDAATPSACTSTLEALRFDFESGADGFVHARMPEVAGAGNSWTFDHWERGSASTICPSGSQCWGTNLDGNYIQCQRAYLVSAPIDLSDCQLEGQDLQLLFDHNYDFWTGAFGGTTWFDGGLVEISSDGTNWQSAGLSYPGTIDINPQMTSSYSCVSNNDFYVDGKAGFVGSSAGWVSANINVPAAMASVTFQVRFVYGAGVSSQTTDQTQSMQGTRPGWFVDNLRFQ